MISTAITIMLREQISYGVVHLDQCLLDIDILECGVLK